MNTDNVKQDDSQIQAEEPVTSVEEAPQAAEETSAEEVSETPTEETVGSTEAKSDADFQLSETGEISNESTSSDVHESDQADSEPSTDSEEVELENQDQTSEGKTEEADIAEATDTPQQDDVPGAHWYVVHTYSGHENRVAASLKQRIESEHLEHKILNVLVPTQEKIEIRSGKKENVKEKIFPGYILVRMVLDDLSWLAVRTTQGVTSFVGMSNKPTAIPDREVKSIVSYMTQGAQPTYKTTFLENDTVKIIDGPFAEFIGKVESVDKERGKIKVLVSIFSRETPVELDFLQVAKL